MKKKILLIICSLLLITCHSKPEPIYVGIQCYHGFPINLCDSIRKTVEDYYGVKTVLLPQIDLSSSALSLKKSPV